MKSFVFVSAFCGLVIIAQTQAFILPNPPTIVNPVNTVECITQKIDQVKTDIGVVVGVGNIVNDIINENLKDYGVCLSDGSGIGQIAEQVSCVIGVFGSVPGDLVRYITNFQASLGRLFTIGTAFNPCFF